MQMIARLLEMPTPIVDAVYQTGPVGRAGGASTARTDGGAFSASAIPGKCGLVDILCRNMVIVKQ